MEFKELMLLLSENYQYGIIVCCVVVVLLYVVFSVRLIVTARKVKMNICASAMIPVYNIYIWVRKCIHSRRLKRSVPNLNNSDEEEIEL